MSGPIKSPSRVDTHRFCPAVQLLESREAPAAIAKPDFYQVSSGRLLDQTATVLSPRYRGDGGPNGYLVAGVLRNDYDTTEIATTSIFFGNTFSNSNMTAILVSGPVATATGLPLATPFTFQGNGGFTFRAPRNFNGPVTFTYQALAVNGALSAVTTVAINVAGPVRRVAVAADATAGPSVAVYDATTNTQLFSFFAFDPSFRGGVRVAVGDVNGDRVDDIICGAGGGSGGHVKVFDGVSGREIASFLAFDKGFQGGVNVSTGDLNGDSIDEVIVSAGAGSSAHVKVYDGAKLSAAGFDANLPSNQLASFLAYGNGQVDGVRTAVGDIDGDGKLKLLTAPAKGSTAVKAFDLSSGTAVMTKSFFAGNPADSRGLYITAGDFNADSIDDIAVGSGSGTPEARIYRGDANGSTSMALERGVGPASSTENFAADLSTNPLISNPVPAYLVGTLSASAATPTSFAGVATTPQAADFGRQTGGMRVGVDFANRDNYADLILGQGPGGYARFQILSGIDFTTLADKTPFAGFFGGISVAGHF